MQQKIYSIFAANFLIISVLYILFVNRLKLPSLTKRLLFLSFLVSPIYLPIKGVESLLYIHDVIGPLLIGAAAIKGRSPTPKIRRLRFLLLTFLILWPLLATGLVFIIGNDDGTQFDSRGILGLLIWLYRNAVLFSVFVLASSIQLSAENFKALLTGFLTLSLGLAALAAVNYLRIYDLAIFEQVLASFDWESPFNYANKSPLGWGFLGMFRGSMGQWYANSALLGLSGFMLLTGPRRFTAILVTAISIVLVLCSFSRAGMVAIVSSTLVYASLLGMRGSKLILLASLCLLAIAPLLKTSSVQDRVESITGYATSKEQNRVDGWRLSLHHFQDENADFMVGVGASNRQKVAKSIGAFGAHNEYIDSIFRAGIGGLILLLIVISSFIKHSFWSYRRARGAIEKAAFAVAPALFLSNAILGITQDHLFRSFSSYVTGPMMYLFYGVLIAMTLQRKSVVSQHTIDANALLIQQPNSKSDVVTI